MKKDENCNILYSLCKLIIILIIDQKLMISFIILIGIIYFLFNSIDFSNTEIMINNLTKDNIDAEFNKARCGYEHRQHSDFKIYQKTIKTKTNSYQIFKIDKNNETDYIASEFKEIIGEGGFGRIYEGFSVITKKIIIIKRVENVYENEIECLKKIGTYIANTWNTILMERAEGISYQNILMNNSISDKNKIILHKIILIKIIELHKKFHIIHNDMKPAHIFIGKNDNITFIDFGLSRMYDSEPLNFNSLNSNLKSDIDVFNQIIENYYFKYCGKEFCDYIDTFRSNISIFRRLFDYFFKRSNL